MAQNDLVNYPTENFGLQQDELMFMLLRVMSLNPFLDQSAMLLKQDELCSNFSDSVEYWTAKADNAVIEAKVHQDSGNIHTSREFYLRASHYYRNAEYFENPLSLNHKSVGMKCRDAFWIACFMFDIPIEIADIPYNNTPIPGYFMKSKDKPVKGKTIIVTGGLDTSAEDQFMIFAPIAMKRGYNLLVYDGPGQSGMQRYFPELTFRVDYEYPVKAAIDYILERDECKLLSAHFKLGGIYRKLQKFVIYKNLDQ